MPSATDLASRVAEIALRLHRRSRQEEAVHGLTGARLSALARLVSDGALSLTELAGAEGVSAPTMARIIDGLQEGKLVVRQRARGDGRIVMIIPTALGRTLLLGARRRRLRWLERFLEDLRDEDRADLDRALHILARAAEQDVG